jgi:hypothetical protein
MAANSIEKLCEEYFIQLFRTHSSLKGKEFRRSDSQEVAEPNVITIEAKQGEDLLDGPQGPNGEKRCKVEVTARYRSTTTGPSGNDLVAEGMQTCIRTASTRPTSVQQTPGFWLMILNEDIRGARSHTKSTRQREITIPCEAGLISHS